MQPFTPNNFQLFSLRDESGDLVAKGLGTDLLKLLLEVRNSEKREELKNLVVEKEQKVLGLVHQTGSDLGDYLATKVKVQEGRWQQKMEKVHTHLATHRFTASLYDQLTTLFYKGK